MSLQPRGWSRCRTGHSAVSGWSAAAHRGTCFACSLPCRAAGVRSLHEGQPYSPTSLCIGEHNTWCLCRLQVLRRRLLFCGAPSLRGLRGSQRVNRCRRLWLCCSGRFGCLEHGRMAALLCDCLRLKGPTACCETLTDERICSDDLSVRHSNPHAGCVRSGAASKPSRELARPLS